MASTPARWGDGVVPSYDAIAEQYAEQYFDELDGKAFDRNVLRSLRRHRERARTRVRPRLRPRTDRALFGRTRRRCVRDRRVGVDSGDGTSSQSHATVPSGRFL